VQRTPLERAAALVIVALAAAAGVAGTMIQPVQEQLLEAPSASEPENSSAMDSQARTRRSPVHQASILTTAPPRLVVNAAYSPVSEPRAVPRESFTTPVLHPSAGVSLPLEHMETGADGLPATGLRCSNEGGFFQCGACRTDSDCPAGRGCVANRETRQLECMESECEEDGHCFPGLVCRRVTTGVTGSIIRRCVAAGQRRLGEACDTLFISQEGACQEGLVCHRGVCSASCRLDDASSCAEGLDCEEGPNGAACFPDCRAQGCPNGQRCKRLHDKDYQCLEQVQGECPETPCAEGEQCNMRLSRGRGVFWCARVCDPLRADSCPADQICGVGGGTVSTCYRRCDPMAPDSCGEGSLCTTITEDMTQWGCRPGNAGGL
jgi:hypothetical protein